MDDDLDDGAAYAISGAIGQALQEQLEGLDPALVQRLLQGGPEDEIPADILEAIDALGRDSGSLQHPAAAGAGAAEPEDVGRTATADEVAAPSATNQENGIQVCTFTEEVGGPLASFRCACQSFLMNGSVYVWIGSAAGDAHMGSLTASTLFRGSPTLSPLLRDRGVGAADSEESFARRLTIRLQQPCFVSDDLPPGLDDEVRSAVEQSVLRRLVAEREKTAT